MSEFIHSDVESLDKASLRLPACLIIMDGYGLAPDSPSNAISLASTPVLDKLFANGPWARLEASGEAVGLPEGQMGNSEVGHLNIGAGRVVFQELTRVNRACRDGSIASNPRIVEAFESAKSAGGTVHFMGLLSDGGVHSSNEHLYALMRAAQAFGIPRVRVHCFMDGRDVPPASGATYISHLLAEMDDIRNEALGAPCDMAVASISGRYYAMDRDNRWERVERAFHTLVCAENYQQLDPVAAMEASYAAGVTDEFVVPVSLDQTGICDGDAVVFFNFRPDRAREITRAFVDDAFEGFERKAHPRVSFVCLTEYDPEIEAPVAFAREFPENVLADVLAAAGLSQYHIAETEKYAHVTFFLNGGREAEKPGETRVLIPSPKVATYDLQPHMSEPEVAETLAAAIRAREADVYLVNFANCDMVGHTGVIPAAVCAVEAVDRGVGKVLEAMREVGGITFITADHGNADKMLADDGSPHTAHTTALVPFACVDESGSQLQLRTCDGCLADIAPTLLNAIGLSVPPEMTGNCLLANG